MERILSTELAAHAGEEVVLQGWLHRQRRLANVSFVVLRDRAGLAQIVLEEAADLLPETVLEVRGRVVTEPQVELHDAQLTVLAEPAEQPPLELHRPEPKESLPVRLDLAPLALRHPAVRERFRVAARAVRAFRETLDARGFTEIQTPKLVATATEGGANLFRVDYFGGDAFLAQSPQFFKQTMVGVFERVYEVGPVFRAEPHETGRHLSEYVSLDAELGFIRDHHDVMAVLRDVVCAMIEAAGGTPPSDVPVVRFEDVRTGEEPDLAPEDERRICAEHGELVLRRRVPDGEAALLYAPRSRPAGVVARVRPAVPRARDRDGRPAASPLRRLRRSARRPRPRPGAVRDVPRRLQVRDAAAWRLRHRSRAVHGAGAGARERPRDHPLPAGQQPPLPVTHLHCPAR